jgi:hypothetical protein
MSVGVGPNPQRAGARAEVRISRETPAAEGLRLPEERAFDVATINRRLASMAREAAPRAARLRS